MDAPLQPNPRRPRWHWAVLLALMAGSALVGLLGLMAPEPDAGMALPTGALALAFALHYFSISLPIHSARWSFADTPEAKEVLQTLAFRVVSHAMFVMGAGLAVVLFAGAAVAFAHRPMIFAAAGGLYCLSAMAMIGCVAHFARTLRHWPDCVDRLRERSIAARQAQGASSNSPLQPTGSAGG